MSTDVDVILDSLQREFVANADPHRAASMVAYMRDQFPYFGLPAPRLRLISRTVRPLLAHPTQTQLTELVTRLWAMPEREFQYYALDEIQRHTQICRIDFLETLETLIVTKSWWDTVDVLSRHGAGALVARHPHLRSEMGRWLRSNNMWLVRSAILHQERYKVHTDSDWLFAACLHHAGNPEFFIRKAIGWALRSYASVDLAAVQHFVEIHDAQLSGLSKREALKRRL